MFPDIFDFVKIRTNEQNLKIRYKYVSGCDWAVIFFGKHKFKQFLEFSGRLFGFVSKFPNYFSWTIINSNERVQTSGSKVGLDGDRAWKVGIFPDKMHVPKVF
jgi:hypothetical protein